MGNFMSVEGRETPEAMPYSDSEWAIFKCPIQTILTIMDYLPDQADVSRCMRTCRKLFFRGERILLRRLVHVTEDNLESFCLFMRRDLDRGRFLRNISLEFTTIGGGDAQTLIATMKRASNLKKLEIAAPVLQADWRVPIALGELTSVEELKVEGYNNEMHHFLMNLYCPVRKATICFRIPDGPDTPTLDMLHSLSRFHDTLEDLSADYVTWLSIRSRPASIFPKLWALHLKDHSIRDISILENALPNLRILVDGNYLKLKESYSLGGDRSPWPLLEFLHIHPGSYLAPTVLSKVDTLRFDVSDRQKFNSLGYRAIILQTQPKRLILRTYSVDASITPALLSTPSTRIRTLAIVWSTLDSWGATSWIDHIEAIERDIKGLRLNITRLVLKMCIYSPTETQQTAELRPQKQQSFDFSRFSTKPISVPSPLTLTTRAETTALASLLSCLSQLEFVTVVVEGGKDNEQFTLRANSTSRRRSWERVEEEFTMTGL